MKVRVLTSAVLVAFFIVVYFYLHTLLLNAVIAFISAVGVRELLRATKILPYRGLSAIAIFQAITIPFVLERYMRQNLLLILLCLILFYFVYLVKNFGKISFEQIAAAFMFGTLIPLFYSSAIYIRDEYGVSAGGFYLLIALGAAWFTDTGAFFTGTFFGKRKLAPDLSPKKTWEGAIGGAVICTALILAVGLLARFYFAYNNTPVAVDFLRLALFAPVYSVVGMLGDLFASAIKREYGIKDFGGIMPGHGGILDRFDSVLFTLPAVYATVSYIEFLTFLT